MRVFALVCLIACVCSADMTLYLIKEAAIQNGAVCLDGTPGGYYYEPGVGVNSTKWVFYMIGGGLCWSELECVARSQTQLGSMKYWPETFVMGGPLYGNPEYNPDFYDWNHVVVPYCDGACFGGDVEEPLVVQGYTIYFRGHRILKGVINELLKTRGMDSATEVLVTGSSAGAMSTFFHADTIKSMMPSSVKRFKALPMSGVFLDHPNAEGKPVSTPQFKKSFEMQNLKSTIIKSCIDAMPEDEQYKCMFAQYNMNYVNVPMFVLNSAYDQWATYCILGAEPIETFAGDQGNCSAVPGWSACEKDPSQCTQAQWQVIEEYGNSFMNIVENHPAMKKNGNGLFEYNCHTHAVEVGMGWMYYTVQGTAMRDAVRKWYFSDNEPSSNHFYKDCVNHGSYSCNPTCALASELKH